MSEGQKPPGPLALYGERLIRGGYLIIPIVRGTKRPPGDKWQHIHATPARLKKWLEAGRGRDGVGILTENTPAVDIDVRDDEVARKVEAFVNATVGMAPTRVGEAPKRLLVFRTSEPFRKITSNSYVIPGAPLGENGKPVRNRIEILGAGQQFVAYAIHPDTKKPYKWLYGDDILKTPRDDLPEITPEQGQAICDYYQQVAVEAGWRLYSTTREQPRGLQKIDHDDPFADVAEKVTIADGELQRKLMLIPQDGTYETWLNIGFALYHQYDGEPEGLELWDAWSQSGENYDGAEIEEKWKSLAIEGKGRQPLTARIILKMAQEFEEKLRTETFAEVKTKLHEARDNEELIKVCEEIKHIEFEHYYREILAQLVAKRGKEISGFTVSIGAARGMIRYENPELKIAPAWIKDWVYCAQDEMFYNTESRTPLSVPAFNSIYSRRLLTKRDVLEGRSKPENLPADMALNVYQVPVVYSQMYLPGEDRLYSWQNKERVNTYDDSNVPELPEKLNFADRQAVALVMDHFEHLFDSVKDREHFIDWIAYIVQNPGKRVNWAVLIQGTEGDGKSFFYALLAAMLAPENCRTIGAQALEEKYTAWAQGTQLVFVEEIMLQGHNRYDVVNKIKPNITNFTIPIRRMNVDLYEVLNTASYLLTTNFRDAMPISANDTRYLMLFSKFQTKEQIDAFEKANPYYYDRLFGAAQDHAGALRKAFMERDLSQFRPQKRAPDSVAKAQMVHYGKTDEQLALEELLTESPRLDMTKELLNITDLPDEMTGKGADCPIGRTLTKLLLSNGLSYVGRIRAGDGFIRYWSSTPHRWFGSDGKIDALKIRNWLKNPL